MSSAPEDESRVVRKKSGAPTPQAASAPVDAARRWVPARAGLYLPAPLRWVLLALMLLLLLGSTWLAAHQAPRPDMFQSIGHWDIGSPDWWRYPLERNAFKRQIVRGDLNSVFLLPGTNKLWAVGDSGLILHSDDGGTTWSQQHPATTTQAGNGGSVDRAARPQPPKAQPATGRADAQPAGQQQPRPLYARLDAVFFVDTQRGWAVGVGGTILATRDGGSTWAAQTSGTEAWLSNMYFAADGQRGWAVGGDGTILATRDGGSTWATQASGTMAWLHSVQFAADGQRGWAAGGDGTILATRDGGATWATQTSGTEAWLNSMHFAADGQRGWVAGGDGTILATRDGGATWAAQASGTEAWLHSVQFAPDGQHGWAVGRGSTILATRDGGATWTAQASSTEAWLNSVQFAADGQHGWAVGRDGSILATRDGGATWTAQVSGAKAWLTSVQFAASGQRGWAVGRGGSILATHDGGATWIAQPSGVKVPLYSVQLAADGQRGWAVGGDGIILATRDGGATWTTQASGTKASLYSVQFVADGRRGWAVGDDGTILATRDGGSTWAAQTSGTEAWLNSVQFAADGQRGWAVSMGDTIVATRDGGATWIAQASGTKAWLNSVQFAADGQRGWAVGDGGTILATRDGGASWIAQPSGVKASLYSVQFAADGQRGWAVGDGGTILATRDGGATWSAQASGTEAWLTSVALDTVGQRGWVVGGGGTVLFTPDAGRQWHAIAPYHRYWAPWYFAALTLLSLAAFTLLGWVASSRNAAVGEEAAAASGGAATFLRSDQPVVDKALDRLGVRPVVEALSSFIRNRDTEPRVTIAITGEWGNGKSSVMRMLQTELNRAGFRTAWFNAWHHQQEGKQMSALFNVVRSQAVPQWWRQPLAAWRVRSRLIWGRGWFYKTVAIGTAFVLALLAGNLLSDGWGQAHERMLANLRHHVLQQKQTAITDASLAKLDPFVQAPPAGGEQALPTTHPCDTSANSVGNRAGPIRAEVYCYLMRNLRWDEGGDTSHCGVQRRPSAQHSSNCVFPKVEDLLATIEARDVTGERRLSPSERKAIRAAAEVVPPPPLFPWLDSAAFGAMAAALVVLFTKGITIYGLQLTAPLRTLLATAQGKSASADKEASGTVERYRKEFSLLCDALDGRLVIFIDDLDRCTPETVNGMLELTNYLTDVGRCFVVLGAAMERVRQCIQSPVGNDPDYPTAYLRKLVHIELPVPQDRALLNQLAAAPPVAEPRRTGLPRWLLRASGVVLVLGVLYLAFLAGSVLHEGSKGEAHEVVVTPVVQPPAPDTKAPSPTQPSLGKFGALQAPSEDVGLVPVPAAVMPHAWLAGASLLLLMGGGLHWLRRHRAQIVVALGGALRSEDSNRFMAALRIWNPVVVGYDPTPRHVKRFFNRARLFAAYEQQQGGQDMASDESLVALAALHHVDPQLLTSLAQAWEGASPEVRAQDLVRVWLNERVSRPAAETGRGGAQARPTREAQDEVLSQAWTQHLQKFGSAPTLEQIRRFARRVQGIVVR